MKRILTKDGSYTLLEPVLGETYHSISGGLEEAFLKFVVPVLTRVNSDKGLIVLDIGFGLGYKTAACLHYFLEHFRGKIRVVGFEQDRKVLELIQGWKVPEFLQEAYKPVRLLAGAGKMSVVLCDRFLIELFVGDARVLLPRTSVIADAVFLDPFSPKRAPELWGLGFMRELRRHIRRGGILATYSCARIVRDNLRAAGFSVEDGPCVGRRAPSTLAVAVGKLFK